MCRVRYTCFGCYARDRRRRLIASPPAISAPPSPASGHGSLPVGAHGGTPTLQTRLCGPVVVVGADVVVLSGGPVVDGGCEVVVSGGPVVVVVGSEIGGGTVVEVDTVVDTSGRVVAVVVDGGKVVELVVLDTVVDTGSVVDGLQTVVVVVP